MSTAFLALVFAVLIVALLLGGVYVIRATIEVIDRNVLLMLSKNIKRRSAND